MPSKYSRKLPKVQDNYCVFKNVHQYRSSLGVCSNYGRTGAFAPSKYHKGVNKQINSIPCSCGGIFQRVITT